MNEETTDMTERNPAIDPEQPHAKSRYEVSPADLPLHCPTPEMSLWNSHPRVYLPLEENRRATCPYCGTEYVLKDAKA